MTTPKLVLAAVVTLVLALSGSESRAEDPLHRSCPDRQECRLRGLCSEVEGRCAAATDADCADSDFCHHGKCHARAGRCVALSESDCQRAPVCAQRGWCTLRDGACQPQAVSAWEPRDEGGSGAALGAGIALTALGSIGLVGGFVALLRAVGEGMNCDEGGGVTCEDDSSRPAAVAIGVGAVAIGVGIPLTVIGARDKQSPEHEVRVAIGVKRDAQTLNLAVSF